MATNFLHLATTLEYLGAKCLPKKKVNFVPCATIDWTGFLLGFVKGGNKFAKAGGQVDAGGCSLANFSQGMMGVRWPKKGWEPNIKLALFGGKRMFKPRAISLQAMDFRCDIICWMF